MLAASLAAQTRVNVPIGKQARAVVCRQANSEVVVETIQVESPRGREVMIEMAACGVCHSDLSVVNGTIPLPPPVILGHEGAGVVVEVGADVEGLAVGDHVISCFISACGKCRYCPGTQRRPVVRVR